MRHHHSIPGNNGEDLTLLLMPAWNEEGDFGIKLAAVALRDAHHEPQVVGREGLPGPIAQRQGLGRTLDGLAGRSSIESEATDRDPHRLAPPIERPELVERAREARRKGFEFLVSSQNADGSWGSHDPKVASLSDFGFQLRNRGSQDAVRLACTAICATALLDKGDDRTEGEEEVLRRAVDALLGTEKFAYHAGEFGKKDQFLKWSDSYWVDAGTRFFFTKLTWVGDGQTIKVHPAYAETYPKQSGGRGPRWLAAGKPVVAVNAGGPAEIIRDGEDGLLVQPGDSRAMGEAALRAARDSRLAAAVGSAARDRAERDFNIRNTVKQMEQVYAALVD